MLSLHSHTLRQVIHSFLVRIKVHCMCLCEPRARRRRMKQNRSAQFKRDTIDARPNAKHNYTCRCVEMEVIRLQLTRLPSPTTSMRQFGTFGNSVCRRPRVNKITLSRRLLLCSRFVLAHCVHSIESAQRKWYLISRALSLPQWNVINV